MSDFTCVSYKKHKKKKNNVDYSVLDINSPSYINFLQNKIQKASNFLLSSKVFSDILSSIEGAALQNNSNIEEIVCYGLGSICDSPASRYQLALLIKLKIHFNCHVYVYDPIFSNIDKEILLKENLNIIDVNEVGKRKVFKPTLFFLPHCPFVLFNNVIAANWGMNLSNCIILGNSLSKIMCSTTDKKLESTLPHLYNISTFVTEKEIKNSFDQDAVFNSLAIHIFLNENLLLVDKNLWNKQLKIESNVNNDEVILTNSIKNIDITG